MKKIFITGGAGYLGSHTCVEILNNDHEVCVFDNLQNSSIEALKRVRLLTNKDFKFVRGDIRNKIELTDAMQAFKPTSVIHFAGLKAVAQSVIEPLNFYETNVAGSVNMLSAMSEINCREIVFSSSATVYGNAGNPPFCETDMVKPISPYGQTKYMVERLLKDWISSNNDFRAVVLEYFNPVGAHVSGMLGEDPRGIPNNLMPLIAQTAQKKRSHLLIYGNDYETSDGTGERDYIHVTDLSVGHLRAVENIDSLSKYQILNLGTGKSTTVLNLINIFRKLIK